MLVLIVELCERESVFTNGKKLLSFYCALLCSDVLLLFSLFSFLSCMLVLIVELCASLEEREKVCLQMEKNC